MLREFKIRLAVGSPLTPGSKNVRRSWKTAAKIKQITRLSMPGSIAFIRGTFEVKFEGMKDIPLLDGEETRGNQGFPKKALPWTKAVSLG